MSKREETGYPPVSSYPISSRLRSCQRSITRRRKWPRQRGVQAQDTRTGEAVVLFSGEWLAEAALLLVMKRGGAPPGLGENLLRKGSAAARRWKGVWDRCWTRWCDEGKVGCADDPLPDFSELGRVLVCDAWRRSKWWDDGLVSGAFGVWTKARGKVNRTRVGARALYFNPGQKVQDSKTLFPIHWLAGE